MEHKILLKKEFYEREAIFAAAHTISHKCIVDIEPEDSETVLLLLEHKKGHDFEFDKIKALFMQNLIDAQFRRDLEKEYGQIKELIVRQAFSPIVNLKDEVDKLK